MQTYQGARQPFIITRQPPEAGDPGETALDHPTARHEQKPVLRLRPPDDDEAPTETEAPSELGVDEVALSLSCRGSLT